MRILLTGAAGQLGRSLRGALADHEVVACTHDELDAADLEVVRAAAFAVRPDLILNAAAYNRVDDAEGDLESAYLGNAIGPRNLAIAAAAIGAAILHVSTDYVFDGNASRPYHEFDRPAPRTVYGESKLAGEIAVRELNPRHYLVRTAWVYHEVGSNFPRTILSLRDRPEVRVVNDQIGSPTYAPHLAEAIARLIPTEAFGTYHFAGAGAASWYELTCALYRRLGVATPVVPVSTEEFPRPAPRPRYSVLTTIQTPRIVLPPWQHGLEEFCARWKETV